MPSTTVSLPFGKTLTVTASGESSVRRLGDVGGVLYQPDPIAAGASQTFGPYFDPLDFELIGTYDAPAFTMTTGTLAATSTIACSLDTVPAETSITIPANTQAVIYDLLTVNGEVEVLGTLRIVTSAS